MNRFLLALLLFLPYLTYGQESSSSKLSLKAYLSGTWYGEKSLVETNSQRVDRNAYLLDFGWLQPAICLHTNRGNFHELSLQNLIITREDEVSFRSPGLEDQFSSGQTDYFIQFGAFYAYNPQVIGSPNNKVRPYLGAGLRPGFQTFRVVPDFSNFYPVTSTRFFADILVVPAIQIDLSEKLFLDLNAPITLYRNQWSWLRTEDPSLPRSQQRSNNYKGEALTRIYQGRIGLGVRL